MKFQEISQIRERPPRRLPEVFTAISGDMGKIRVILADDHTFLRSSIRKILDKTSDITVVGEASNGIEALDLVREHSPDVLVLDVEMPKLNGIQVAKKLRGEGSEVRVLALSAYDDRAHILGMLEAGVSGYLTKDEASEMLVKAVRGVAEGKDGWFSQRAAAKISPGAQKRSPADLSWTERERRFLTCLSEGRTDQQISEEMELSEAAIERYFQILKLKLNASTRQELVEAARRAGLI